MSKPNELICGDAIYTMTPAYLAGAKDARDQVPHFANPYPSSSQEEYDWNDGHTHEHGYEHFRFGKDLITEPPSGQTFNEDPTIPKTDLDEVDPEWGSTQAAKLIRPQQV